MIYTYTCKRWSGSGSIIITVYTHTCVLVLLAYNICIYILPIYINILIYVRYKCNLIHASYNKHDNGSLLHFMQ